MVVLLLFVCKRHCLLLCGLLILFFMLIVDNLLFNVCFFMLLHLPTFSSPLPLFRLLVESLLPVDFFLVYLFFFGFTKHTYVQCTWHSIQIIKEMRERESEKKREKIDFHYQYCICLGAFLSIYLDGLLCVQVISFYLKKNWLLLLLTCYLSIVCVCVHAVVFLWAVQREFSFLFGCFSFDFSHCSH